MSNKSNGIVKTFPEAFFNGSVQDYAITLLKPFKRGSLATFVTVPISLFHKEPPRFSPLASESDTHPVSDSFVKTFSQR